MLHNHWILTNLTISLKDPSDRIHLDYLNLQSVSMNLMILILLISIEFLYITNFRLGLILLEMSANINEAIRLASASSHHECIALLLVDERVDSSSAEVLLFHGLISGRGVDEGTQEVIKKSLVSLR